MNCLSMGVFKTSLLIFYNVNDIYVHILHTALIKLIRDEIFSKCSPHFTKNFSVSLSVYNVKKGAITRIIWAQNCNETYLQQVLFSSALLKQFPTMFVCTIFPHKHCHISCWWAFPFALSRFIGLVSMHNGILRSPTDEEDTGRGRQRAKRSEERRSSAYLRRSQSAGTGHQWRAVFARWNRTTAGADCLGRRVTGSAL